MIAKHAYKMCVGSDGITNALLVLNEKTGEGILVNSEGCNYARYSAYLPFAKLYLDHQISRIADFIVTEGTRNAVDTVWLILFDDLYEHFDMVALKDNGIANLLAAELETRDEIEAVAVTEEGLKFTCGLCLIDPICPQREIDEQEYEVIYQDDVDVASAKHLLWLHNIPGGEQANFSGKLLRNINLNSLKLNNAIFNGAVLKGCKLRGTELCNSEFHDTTLKDCDMTYISVDDMNMKGAFLENCDLSYLIAHCCNFADVKFVHCELFNGKTINCCFDNTGFYCSPYEDTYIDPINDSISESEWREDHDVGTEQEMQ